MPALNETVASTTPEPNFRRTRTMNMSNHEYRMLKRPAGFKNHGFLTLDDMYISLVTDADPDFT
ncbi:MAG: hypothetical protein KTR14_06365 [Vampirovibrio sp.]|nr:hypothetical protein [Vampirovibrio sp.]